MWRGPVFAALLALSCKPAVAKDLGTRGELFPIAERDLFEDIQAKFDALHAAGEVDRINQRLRDRALSGAERPPKVEGISKTATPRAFHFDPTITVQNDIKTADGRLIARAGDQLNPLHLTPMSQRLIFFDGEAVLRPTPENVRNYISYQRIQLDRASAFSDTWRRLIWSEPELDYTLERPVSQLAKRQWLDARRDDKDRLLEGLSDQYGLFYFFAASCSACTEFSAILRAFADR